MPMADVKDKEDEIIDIDPAGEYEQNMEEQ